MGIAIAEKYKIDFGLLAHLGERHACTVEAVGAEPTWSTKIVDIVDNDVR